MDDKVKEALSRALARLGVEIAGRRSDPWRWSVSDLVTDLAPLFNQELTRESDRA